MKLVWKHYLVKMKTNALKKVTAVHLWFMDTFFARRKEEEDGGESTYDNDNSNSSNNSNLNNKSDNGNSTASKGTLDTALVHSDIEEEALLSLGRA
mmetsp:Transcript_124/g.210  ORF Transcript_124/g.210 Transcript_124/m.210 type:complete len:96 (+) Transcript_124:903-1190(+)